MNLEEYRFFCLSLPGTEEALPFDDNVLTFKVGGKIYSLTHIDSFQSINLKCDPEKATILREEYPFIIPGNHMNKKHWNTLENPTTIDSNLLKELTIHSYQLIYNKLTKKTKEQIEKDFSQD